MFKKQNKDTTTLADVVLVTLLLTLNKFRATVRKISYCFLMI